MTSAPHRALIVKPGSMGDVVHALPVAAAMARAWPDCRITWLVDDRWRGLLEGNPHLGDCLVFPRRRFGGAAGLFRALPWVAGLRHERPDVCVDLQGLLRSGIFAAASLARRVVCLSDAREGARFFAHEAARVDPSEHSVLRYLRVCGPLGIAGPHEPEFHLPPGIPPETPPPAPFVLVHPFARGRGKSLRSGALEALCAGLAPCRVVLAGAQAPPATRVPDGAINLLGQTRLDELLWLVRNAAFVVSVDSGPAHLAAAVGTPLLAIHTWSNPSLVGPFSRGAFVWHEGVIRRQDFRVHTPAPQAREPTPEDAGAIAQHVRSVLAGDPRGGGGV
jgi:heptosyltransferase I